MEHFYHEAEKQIVRMLGAYVEMQRKQHEYCPNIWLYPSEAHAIECVALVNPINMTELAKMLGLSKGGATKCVAKLDKMGLLRRYKYVQNQKEVYLHLTEMGVQVFEGHKRYHHSMEQAMKAYCEQLDAQKKEGIIQFLGMYLEQMHHLLDSSDTEKQEKGR